MRVNASLLGIDLAMTLNSFSKFLFLFIKKPGNDTKPI
jgi:hypothetical protein